MSTVPGNPRPASGLPAWLTTPVDALAGHGLIDASGINRVLDRQAPADTSVRAAAVLVLFGGDASSSTLPPDASVLLTRRASTMRQHGGQVAFPGGATDPEDDGPLATALREAREETGLDPAGVTTMATLPSIFVPPSSFQVTPVLAYWHEPSPVGVVDPAETESVVAVPVADLLDPANRFVVKHPLGYAGPAFSVQEMLVWGLTAGIIAGILSTFGWELPWDVTDIRDLQSSLDAVEAELWR